MQLFIKLVNIIFPNPQYLFASAHRIDVTTAKGVRKTLFDLCVLFRRAHFIGKIFMGANIPGGHRDLPCGC